ncbi:MAG: hypothetical protein RDV48_03105 [Candidatus Eremiobacteraeota bacterium]|nr:hypothetical protein [Candidatus Eremiobacteraeota bacterium]
MALNARRHGGKLLLFSLLFVVIAWGHAAAQSFVCSSCGYPITGRYWQYEGRVYCDQCYQKVAPRCSKCGQVPQGKYWTGQGGITCDECYRKTAPRCAVCGQIPPGKYWKGKDGILCDKCYAIQGPRCTVCGEIITGKYKYFENTGKKYCQDCVSLYAACSNCGGPVGPSGIAVERKLTLCPDCAKEAIFTTKQIMPLYLQVRGVVRGILGIEIAFNEKNIILTDGNTLHALNSSRNEYVPRDGIAGLHHFDGAVSTIYVRKGQSPEMAFDTLCHEYTHAWQARYCPPDQSTIFREGFAEWVSYKALLYKKYLARAKLKVSHNDPTYGEGLRKMLELEKRYGASSLVQRVKSLNDFPQ